MAKCDIGVPAAENFKCLIGNGLVEAEQKCNEYYSSMESRCGNKQNVWNYRYQCIREELKKADGRYKAPILSKVIWEYMPIFDTVSQCLYILLKQERFNELQKAPQKNQTHYAKSPSLSNSQFDKYDKVNEQLRFFELSPIPDSVIKFRKQDLQSLQELLGADVKMYAIITFTVRSIYGITSMHANIVDSKFQLVATEPWTEYIPVSSQPADIPFTEDYQDMHEGIILGAKNRIDSKPKLKIISKQVNK